ncbi:hypothetical protein [Kutzneria buriramensis]|uniref:hypothetical protein n=1 Tax=Kutzneria buriramensis TaxID=1045776 RepID=UPI0011C11A74|nr:hypothetical protein [Kutzneria buriramensis]
MTSTEIIGLEAAINYACGLSAYCTHTFGQVSAMVPTGDEAAASCEQAQADLAAGGVTGDTLTDVASVQEQMTGAVADLNAALAQLEVAGAAAASLQTELESHRGVKDAYNATPDAGSKEFVTTEDGTLNAEPQPTPGSTAMNNTGPAVPAEAGEDRCPQCGAGMCPDPAWPAEVRESDGSASVSLRCSAGCGSPGRLYRWQVSREEYQAIYGEVPDNLLLPGDDRLLPPPPDARSLPPGPWGYFKVEPSPIPDEAWEVACTNKVGRWRTRECGAILTPDPKRVFYYDEFTSSATVGFRCPVCKVSLENFKWPLTLDQHYAIFGRSPDEYVPEYDPTDESDFQALYSMWQTKDRGMLTHFATIDELAGGPDLDLRAIGPGEFTIKHWPTGATWDVPDFVAQHEQVIADYDKFYAEPEPEGDDEDEDEDE